MMNAVAQTLASDEHALVASPRKLRDSDFSARLPHGLGTRVSLFTVAVTAMAMNGDRQKCDAGVTDYISKPIDIDLLLALLRVRFGRRRTIRQVLHLVTLLGAA